MKTWICATAFAAGLLCADRRGRPGRRRPAGAGVLASSTPPARRSRWPTTRASTSCSSGSIPAARTCRSTTTAATCRPRRRPPSPRAWPGSRSARPPRTPATTSRRPSCRRGCAARSGAPTATLMDDDGKIGRAYGARTTPHMYIVDPQGKLVYAGAHRQQADAPTRPTSRPRPTTSTRRSARSLAGKPVEPGDDARLRLLDQVRECRLVTIEMAMRLGRALASGLVFCAFTVAAFAARADPASAPAASPARYTFSWPLGADQPRPRGGVTRGAPVVLDPAPSPAWQALQATGLDAAERDRRAILAMAGSLSGQLRLSRGRDRSAKPRRLAPYQSWATEKVYVDRDEPGFISLVHILEMRLVGSDGTISEPHVTKHWRQDWRYEPDASSSTRAASAGGVGRWPRRAARRWLQTVHQVDESPRYAAWAAGSTRRASRPG